MYFNWMDCINGHYNMVISGQETISENIDAQWVCGDPYVEFIGENDQNRVCFTIKASETYTNAWSDGTTDGKISQGKIK